jgi:hypothetical protein
MADKVSILPCFDQYFRQKVREFYTYFLNGLAFLYYILVIDIDAEGKDVNGEETFLTFEKLSHVGLSKVRGHSNNRSHFFDPYPHPF